MVPFPTKIARQKNNHRWKDMGNTHTEENNEKSNDYQEKTLYSIKRILASVRTRLRNPQTTTQLKKATHTTSCTYYRETQETFQKEKSSKKKLFILKYSSRRVCDHFVSPPIVHRKKTPLHPKKSTFCKGP